MLNSKNIKIYLFVCLLLSGFAFYLNYVDISNKYILKEQELGYFLPELKNNIDKLDYIFIKNLDVDLEIKKNEIDNSWYLSNKDNYPVENNRVLELLRDLSFLEIKELKTSDPRNFSKLSLDNPLEIASDAIYIEIGNKKLRTKILLGKREGVRFSDKFIDKVYTRKIDSSQVFLTEGKLPRHFGLSNFAKQFFSKIAPEDISSIKIISGKKTVILEKSNREDINFSLKNIDQNSNNKKEKDPKKNIEEDSKDQYLINMIPKSISNISFYDLIIDNSESKLRGVSNINWEKTDSIEINTFNSFSFKIKLGKTESGYLIKITDYSIDNKNNKNNKTENNKYQEFYNSIKDTFSNWNYMVSELDLEMLFD